MKPVTKMIWLFVLIIIAAALFFVVLDDDDTKTAPGVNQQQTSAPAKN